VKEERYAESIFRIGVTMEIVIKGKNAEPVYMIKEHGGTYPCFELFSWKPERTIESGKYMGGVAKAGFVSQGRYPSTLPHAMRMIAECITRDSQESTDCVLTVESLRAHATAIERLLDSFGVEVVEDSGE
jgi:hypothetical protein